MLELGSFEQRKLYEEVDMFITSGNVGDMTVRHTAAWTIPFRQLTDVSIENAYRMPQSFASSDPPKQRISQVVTCSWVSVTEHDRIVHTWQEDPSPTASSVSRVLT